MSLAFTPTIDVDFYKTTINDEVFKHQVTLGLLIDSEGNDVTSLKQLPLVGTKVKTLGFTLERGETIFYETTVNANVRPLPEGLQIWAGRLMRAMRYITGLFAFFVEAKEVFKDKKDPIHIAIKEFNKSMMGNNAVLKSIDDSNEDEMFKSLDIIGKIIINGEQYLLLRITFQGHSVLFFDISKNMNF
jgi:hypothetical protein